MLIGLAVVGAGLGIYSRYQEYANDHGGNGPSGWHLAGVIGLGIADLTGLPYIIEAGVGRRAFAPQPMSRFEAYERGTQGVINLALLALGGAKKLFGRPEPTAPVAVRPKPVPDGTVPADGSTPTPVERPGPVEVPEAAPPITKARMTELIREIEGGLAPEAFTPEHAAALAENARLASAKWVRADGTVPWDSISNQLALSRWRFLPRAPEAAAILRAALNGLPEAGPLVNGVSAKARMLAALDVWVGGGHPPQVVVPPHLPTPPHENDPEPVP